MAIASSNVRRKFKIVLLGEGRVGKTSILLRYCRNEYDGKQTPTLNASYIDRRLSIGRESVQLSIWDTAGQERFHALGPIYYRDADAALLVYDITDAESFEKVQNWVKELRKIVGDRIIIAIAGNKVDLEKNRNVDDEKAKEYAAKVNAEHFYTSAKLNKGLEEVFLHLARMLLDKFQEELKQETAEQQGRSTGRDVSRIVVVEEESNAANAVEDSGCC